MDRDTAEADLVYPSSVSAVGWELWVGHFVYCFQKH